MRLHALPPLAPPERASTQPEPMDGLYETYSSDVRRWARRLAGPRVDLEDLVHDVFVIALRRGFSDRGEGSVKTWLFRITHHVVRNWMRRRYIRRLLFLRHEDSLASETATPSTPLEEIEQRERHMRLYKALDQLADCYRTTLILYEIEGLSGEEVAELTGITVETVWVRLHRGRAKLLDLLSKGEKP